MYRTLSLVAVSLLIVLTLAAPAASQTADADGARRAALDYLEGFYEGSPDKIRRGVHPEVVKYGFYRPDGAEGYQGTGMTFEEMIGFAENVRDEGSQPGPDAPKEVILLDVQDQIAVAKVVAWWGSDYLQMAKYNGEWKVMHVVWQSPQITS